MDYRRGFYPAAPIWCFPNQFTVVLSTANTISKDAEVKIIVFSSDKSDAPDAFVFMSVGDKDKLVSIKVSGCKSSVFSAFRSADSEKELYKSIGNYSLKGDVMEYIVPARSVTTFYAFDPKK